MKCKHSSQAAMGSSVAAMHGLMKYTLSTGCDSPAGTSGWPNHHPIIPSSHPSNAPSVLLCMMVCVRTHRRPPIIDADIICRRI